MAFVVYYEHVDAQVMNILKSLGIDEHKIPTAIGIRTDETRRVNPKVAEARTLEYPLIDVWPSDKQDVLDWCWASGVDKTAVEAALAQNIELQKNPPVSQGLPWSQT